MVPLGRDYAHDLRRHIRHVDVAGGIHRDAVGIFQLGCRGRSAIAGVAGSAVAGDAGQRYRSGIHLEYRMHAAEIEIARGIHSHAGRVANGSADGRNRGGQCRAARDCRDDVLLRLGKAGTEKENRKDEKPHGYPKERTK